MLPLVPVRLTPMGVGSSSSPEMEPSAETLRGPILGLRSSLDVLLLGSPEVPRTLWAKRAFVGLPYLDGVLAGVVIDGRGPGVICIRRTGESGRGREVLGARFSWGLGARAPGPTEALNLGRPGVGGV